MAITFKKLSETEFDAFIHRDGRKILEEDKHGIKVLETADGSCIIKIFRRKRLISSATLMPYAVRFIRNAETLTKKGFRCVSIKETYHCPENNRHIVVYEKLEGMTLRDALSDDSISAADRQEWLRKYAAFLSQLHAKGVYFRSIHFGNVLCCPDGEFGLIDVSDMSISGRSLSQSKRHRNFQHALRYDIDITLFEILGCDSFLDIYAKASEFSDGERIQLHDFVMKRLLKAGTN